VSPDAIEKERNIYRAQMEGSGKPANVLDKIIEGKLGGFYSQFVLLDQPFVRDPSLTITQLVAETSAKTGENITVSRFVRYRVGDGE
jgi:elongation factor Ts